MRADSSVCEFVLARCTSSTSSVGGGPNNPSLCKTGTGTSGVPVASFSRRRLTARAYTEYTPKSGEPSCTFPAIFLSLSLSLLSPSPLSVCLCLCLCLGLCRSLSVSVCLYLCLCLSLSLSSLSLCLCLGLLCICLRCLCLSLSLSLSLCLFLSLSLFLRLCGAYVPHLEAWPVLGLCFPYLRARESHLRCLSLSLFFETVWDLCCHILRQSWLILGLCFPYLRAR